MSSFGNLRSRRTAAAVVDVVVAVLILDADVVAFAAAAAVAPGLADGVGYRSGRGQDLY